MISKSQIKLIRSLHTKKQRQIERCFIAEGVKTIAEIANEQADIITELFCTDEFYGEYERLLKSKKINTTIINDKELSQISQLTSPNGVLAICKQLTEKPNSTNLNASHAFYLDDIRDPGNLGTIIRLCSWFGIKDLFCSPETVELYNPKCIQSCMGAFLRVNVHYAGLKDLIASEKIKTIYSTELKGKDLYKEDLKGGLIIIGNEANGVSAENARLATQTLTIPSAAGNTESLNAAIATSIIASEFFRKSL